MEKRTYESDIITLSLLYRKEYVGTDMLSYDKIVMFDKVINDNLDVMNACCCIGTRLNEEDNSKIWFMMLNENGEKCAVINPTIDLKKISDSLFGYLPIEVIVASQMDNALKEIDLITVNHKIIDRNSYYKYLREKYHLRSCFQQQQFDLFRDWERLPENGFVENFCISPEEKKTLYELRENKKENDMLEQQQISTIRRVKKR